MISPVRRWIWSVPLVAAGLAMYASLPAATADTVPGASLASGEQLKVQAMEALKVGKFDKTNELLDKAASLSHDPRIEQMAAWTKGFENQRVEFAAARHKSYEKSVEDVKKLLERKKDDYAVDGATRRHLLADDKKAFRDEPWVDAMVKGAIERAEQYDKDEQWVKSLRLYSDLSSIEPATPLWKDRLKLATRRVRLLALYTPEVLKKLQESEQKERDEVDAILKPATQPTTGPTTGPVAGPTTKPLEGVDNESFKVDWRDTLKGVKMEVLWDALVDARNNYYREVSFRNLALGGLKGMQALATTKGLEAAFPRLKEEPRRVAFLAAVADAVAQNQAATPATEQNVLRTTLKKLQSSNKETVELPEVVLVSEFADGAFAELDPFSSIIWPTDVEEFRKTTQGEFSGVGIQIQTDDDGSLKVVSPLEDSPAYKAGIKAGDVITQIDGKSAKGITLNQAVKSITGEKGTLVTLTVRGPEGASKVYPIKRETIHVASIKGYLHKPGGGWEWFVDPAQKVAYMRLTNFTQDTSKELDRAVEVLKEQGAKAVILDLRYNPGGLLTAATEVCDKFLSEGVIVSTHPDRETGNPPTIAKAKKDDDECNLPLIVLVNQYSASASEIVSGCLKDNHRATIVGERTFGKGSVQMLFPLDRTTLLKLTTSHYYLPNGVCIHREENSSTWGVDPDVTIEMTPEQMRAAIDARQDLDILRDAAGAKPAEGAQEKLNDTAPLIEKAVEQKKDKIQGDPQAPRTASKKKDLLESDPQLSAAVLMLRLQLAAQ